MTLLGQCGLAAIRGTVAALVCTPVAACLHRTLSGRLSTRPWVWALALLPFIVPPMLVGYAYSNFSLSLVRYPLWNELLYDLLTWVRLTPVALLVLHVAPAGMSRRAVHCRRLLRPVDRGGRAHLAYGWFLVKGRFRGHAVAAAVVFVFAFSDFETASFFGVPTWSVALFDAHAGGLALGESLRLAVTSLLIELALLSVVALLLAARRDRSSEGEPPPSPSRAAYVGTVAYSVGALALAAAIPGIIVLRGTLEGFRTVTENFVLGGDLASSLVFAAASAVCVFVLSGWVADGLRGRFHGAAVPASAAFCALGLTSPLVVSLLTVAAFQAPGLRSLYDTPLPLLTALSVMLLPLAVALRLLVGDRSRDPVVHAASLLRLSSARGPSRNGRRLVLRHRWRPYGWLAVLLFCLAYFDLTASSILAPPDMTPVSVRLYNLMHYCQSSALSAMVCAALALPLAVVSLGAGILEFATRVKSNG